MAALYDLEVRGDGAQVFVGCLVGEVAEAERLGDFAGREEFLELWEGRLAGCRIGEWTGGTDFGWYVECAVGDVEVPDYEDEEGHGVIGYAQSLGEELAWECGC